MSSAQKKPSPLDNITRDLLELRAVSDINSTRLTTGKLLVLKEKELRLLERQQEEMAKEHSKQKALQDLDTVKRLDLKINHKHMSIVEDLALKNNLSIPEATDLFCQKLKGKGLGFMLPENAATKATSMRELAAKYDVTTQDVQECADYVISNFQYGNFKSALETTKKR